MRFTATRLEFLKHNFEKLRHASEPRGSLTFPRPFNMGYFIVCATMGW